MEKSLSCPVCNNLCSTQAVACPKCGHPINKNNQATTDENITPSKDSPRPSTTGSTLRFVLWVFFAISLFFAFDAIAIWANMPRADGYTNMTKYEVDIAFRLAPLIIMIIVLAVIYSAKERP
ncbi:hypothetical protein BH10ACI1_BH10ACI1_09590 [soil metagenome]